LATAAPEVWLHRGEAEGLRHGYARTEHHHGEGDGDLGQPENRPSCLNHVFLPDCSGFWQ
jgi:hypothetical protein